MMPSILDLYAQLFANTDQASQNRKELLPEHSNAFWKLNKARFVLYL
jgi:hypothetical protein